MKLTTEQENRILDNIKLVGFTIKKLGIYSSSFDYEDIFSVGTIGLVKASRTFDPKIQKTFSSYAIICIKNEILMYFRKNNKFINDISIYSQIRTNDGPISELVNTIPDDTYFTETIEQQECISQIINIILNLLNKNEKLIMLYSISGKNQEFISKHLNFSQSYISRIEIKTRQKLKLSTNLKNDLKMKYSFSIISNDLFQLHFSIKDINNFKESINLHLKPLMLAEDSKNFKIVYDNEQVTINFLKDKEYFYYIAIIMQIVS